MTKNAFMLLVVLAVLSVGACVGDPYDPTGTWALTGHVTSGTCQGAQTFDQPILVVQAGDEYLASSGIANEQVSGTVTANADGATLNLVVNNSDVNGDGGSVRARYTIMASVDNDDVVSGSGSISVTGAATCSSQYTLTGTVRH